ncbi:MAG TPA: hypothetical protein ENG34_00340, partial [Candidatus Aenigmarchaeota archaeon]|nr:hypothetical protein [Candidatus Aenigmarchaeota archaeon]
MSKDSKKEIAYILSVAKEGIGVLESYLDAAGNLTLKESYKGIFTVVSELEKKYGITSILIKGAREFLPNDAAYFLEKIIKAYMKLPWDVALDLLKPLGEDGKGRYKKTEDVLK